MHNKLGKLRTSGLKRFIGKYAGGYAVIINGEVVKIIHKDGDIIATLEEITSRYAGIPELVSISY